MAIIEELSIQFSDGFNVITGETGAGKSILIRALSFLLGQKVGPDTIRHGFEQATVSGEFFLDSSHEGISLLEKWGIPFEKNGNGSALLVRRQINSKGRSSAWVNDVPVTGPTLKELGLSLVDIFGQHDNQKLMKPEFHLSYIDKFVTDPQRVKDFKKQYQAVMESIKGVHNSIDSAQTGTKDLDYRLFRLQELDAFNPSQKDYEALKEMTDNSKSAVELKEGLGQVLNVLEGEQGSLNSLMWNAIKKLGRVCEKGLLSDLDPLKEKGESVAADLDNFTFELSRILNSLEVDESTLEKAHERLYGYQELFRKHGVRDVESLISEHNKLKLDCLSREGIAEKLEKDLGALLADSRKLSDAASQLSKLRMKAGNSIKKTVEKELSELAMSGAKFDISWEDSDIEHSLPELAFLENDKLIQLATQVSETLKGIGPVGYELSEFMLASNPGEPVLPLLRVASGGELSRIMLALKKALVADADTCVLVFDEIDTGISGRVADVVGKKMRKLSDSFQVLCISHLPQVAVYADTHFLVKKEAKSGLKSDKSLRTESTIVRLTQEQSTAEIARLLSGSEVSKAGLANAKALRERAHLRT